MEKENFDADNGKHIAQEEHEPVLWDKEEIMKTPLCSYFERYKRAKSQFDTISKGLKVVCNSLLRNKVTAKELETIQLKYTGKQVEVKPSTYLQLDMKVKEDTDMITEIRLRELPSIWGVRISNVVDSSHIVNNFLKESIPQNLKCIQFNFNSSTEADCEDFVDSLWYAARKVKTNVSIYNTNLSSTHFRRILSAFSHWIEIGFYKCIVYYIIIIVLITFI